MGPIDEGKPPAHRIAEELKPLQSSLQSSAKQSCDDVAQKKHYHITELRGLGKEIWEDIDAQEYVNQERDTWDG